MAQYYAAQQVGVLDGSAVPAARPDGRQVGAKKSSIIASKVAGQAWANGDTIVLGELRPGEMLVGISLNTDTSFGTTTISIGTAASAAKYASAKTVTSTDAPAIIGPKASAMAAGPVSAKETIIATLGVGGVAGAVVASFDLTIVSVK